MKQLNSFMVLTVGGGDRISYTYDEINENTGEPISTNNKANFYVVDQELKANIEAVKTYIRTNKLGE